MDRDKSKRAGATAKDSRPRTAPATPTVDMDEDLSVEATPRSSRLPGFYELPITERLRICQVVAGLSDLDASHLAKFGALSGELVDVFVENGVGAFALPLGIATNFQVNGKDVLVPMAVEETSVVAAASHGAKLARYGGGFTCSSTPPVMTGQIQLLVKDPVDYETILTERKSELLGYANQGQERLVSRGGGAVDLTWRYIHEIKSLVLHLHVDTQDAMGANIVNTMCEKVSALLPELIPCDIGLRILTNLTDRRMTRAACRVTTAALESPEFCGRQVAERIVMAYQFAAHDVYRAATNNKGVMNGIDPVLIATGNDWRAVEAGVHAYASLSGRYRPLAVWEISETGDLLGSIEIPMALGVVGGVTKLHPTARAALKVLGSPSAQELAEIVTAVGLAQNLSALRALASEGIQRGHMSLHKSNLDLLTRHGVKRGEPG